MNIKKRSGTRRDPGSNEATRGHVTDQLYPKRSPRKLRGHETNHIVTNAYLSLLLISSCHTESKALARSRNTAADTSLSRAGLPRLG